MEWKELPDKIQKAFMDNVEAQGREFDYYNYRISGVMSWAGSKEGYDYWERVLSYKKLPKDGELFINKLEGVPLAIVYWMLEQQELQGNKRNVTVFERNFSAGKELGGFDWKKTGLDGEMIDALEGKYSPLLKVISSTDNKYIAIIKQLHRIPTGVYKIDTIDSEVISFEGWNLIRRSDGLEYYFFFNSKQEAITYYTKSLIGKYVVFHTAVDGKLNSNPLEVVDRHVGEDIPRATTIRRTSRYLEEMNKYKVFKVYDNAIKYLNECIKKEVIPANKEDFKEGDYVIINRPRFTSKITDIVVKLGGKWFKSDFESIGFILTPEMDVNGFSWKWGEYNIRKATHEEILSSVFSDEYVETFIPFEDLKEGMKVWVHFGRKEDDFIEAEITKDLVDKRCWIILHNSSKWDGSRSFESSRGYKYGWSIDKGNHRRMKLRISTTKGNRVEQKDLEEHKKIVERHKVHWKDLEEGLPVWFREDKASPYIEGRITRNTKYTTYFNVLTDSETFDGSENNTNSYGYKYGWCIVEATYKYYDIIHRKETKVIGSIGKGKKATTLWDDITSLNHLPSLDLSAFDVKGDEGIAPKKMYNPTITDVEFGLLFGEKPVTAGDSIAPISTNEEFSKANIRDYDPLKEVLEGIDFKDFEVIDVLNKDVPEKTEEKSEQFNYYTL